MGRWGLDFVTIALKAPLGTEIGLIGCTKFTEFIQNSFHSIDPGDGPQRNDSSKIVNSKYVADFVEWPLDNPLS